jgi:hypothetical protein
VSAVEGESSIGTSQLPKRKNCKNRGAACFSCVLESKYLTRRHRNEEPETFSAQGMLSRVGSRALLGAALAVLILYGVGVIALGTPPSASDTGEQVVTWFRLHRDGARWFVWAATASILPFAVMFSRRTV